MCTATIEITRCYPAWYRQRPIKGLTNWLVLLTALSISNRCERKFWCFQTTVNSAIVETKRTFNVRGSTTQLSLTLLRSFPVPRFSRSSPFASCSECWCLLREASLVFTIQVNHQLLISIWPTRLAAAAAAAMLTTKSTPPTSSYDVRTGIKVRYCLGHRRSSPNILCIRKLRIQTSQLFAFDSILVQKSSIWECHRSLDSLRLP